MNKTKRNWILEMPTSSGIKKTYITTKDECPDGICYYKNFYIEIETVKNFVEDFKKYGKPRFGYRCYCNQDTLDILFEELRKQRVTCSMLGIGDDF